MIRKKELKNKLEVYTYLKAHGWKIAKSTIYHQAKQGLLKPNKKGKYNLEDINKYARLHLDRQDTLLKTGADDLQRRKIMAEIARITEQAKMARIKRMAEEGRYILREDMEFELAGKAVVLETALKAMILSRAGEFVALVEGEEKKTGDLVRTLMTELDQTLNEFATTREFHVIFKANSGD